MRPPLSPSRHALALLSALQLAPLALATDFYKADNETVLNSAASWVDASGNPSATAPVNGTGSVDACIWNFRVTALADADLDGIHEVTVGSTNDLGIQTFRIIDPALPVWINGNGRTFTATNGGGVDMAQATQNLTFENVFYRISTANAVIALNVATGRTLTFATNAKVNLRSGATNTTLNVNTNGTSAGTVVFTDTIAATHMTIGAGLVRFDSLTGNPRSNTPTTTVNGGTLVVSNTSNSATGSGAVAINNTATLAGTGIITGAVTAATGSTLAPGAHGGGVGTLTLGSLTLQTGTTYVWEATDTANADRVAVTAVNGLTLNGGTLKLYQPGTTTPFNGTGVYTLFTYAGNLVGSIDSLSIDESTKIPGLTYTLGLGAGSVTLRITNGAITPVDWAVDADGNWSTGSNWTGGTAPNSLSALARITGATGATLTAPRTVTLDTPSTVGQLILDSTQPVTLAGSSALTLNDDGASATLSSSGANHTVNAPITLTAGGILASVEDSSKTFTLGGVVSGTNLGLTKSGSGTLLLTADNTYTGATSISAGTLQLGNGGATGSVAGTITNNGVLRINRSNSLALASVISGTGSVEFAGTGDITLSAANTYSGTTTLSAGTLVLANSLALQSSPLNYSIGGGTLVIADPVTAITLGGLEGNRALPLTNNASSPIALTVGGNHTVPATYSASPLGTGLSFTKTGTGTLNLTGTHAYSGALTVTNGPLNLNAGANFSAASVGFGSNATAKLTVDAATLNISGALTLNNASAGFALANGALATIGGAITNTASDTGANFIHVNGGSTLNAASISLRRGSANNTTEPTGGSTANGIHIQNGTVNLSGGLSLGVGTNSNVSGRIDAGSLNVAGPVNVAINSPDRWTILDINGGAFTSTNTGQGVYLGGDTAAGNVVFLVRGSGVATVPRFQFGKDALGGKSYLNLTGGALYVGSGGMVIGSSNVALDARIRLGNGTLGATADWSSPIPLTLQGVPTLLTGSDASDTPHTITLSGAASGSGQLSKTGSGTVLLTNSANVYSDTVTIDGGTLGLAGTATFGITVNSAGALQPVGVLTSSFGATIDGRLAITYDGANATTPVSRLESGSPVVLGASSSLKVTGTGNLPGPAYTIIKGGVSGTFATVDLPAGLTINYDYDDDNNTGTPGVVALVGSIAASPYDAWTASYSLTGNDALASADPDGDGLANLLEFAFSSSPVAANSAPWTIARSGNFLTLSFNHPAHSGLTYSIEASNDLTGTWTPVHTFPEFTTASTATYTDTVNLGTAGTRRFLRLKITPAP